MNSLDKQESVKHSIEISRFLIHSHKSLKKIPKAIFLTILSKTVNMKWLSFKERDST